MKQYLKVVEMKKRMSGLLGQRWLCHVVCEIHLIGQGISEKLSLRSCLGQLGCGHSYEKVLAKIITVNESWFDGYGHETINSCKVEDSIRATAKKKHIKVGAIM